MPAAALPNEMSNKSSSWTWETNQNHLYEKEAEKGQAATREELPTSKYLLQASTPSVCLPRLFH
jgi:hypothetical protein